MCVSLACLPAPPEQVDVPVARLHLCQTRPTISKRWQSRHCLSDRLQVIFLEPYIEAIYNRHTSPQLDADVASLRADAQAKVAISELKRKFMTHAEALLHGDLHTGAGGQGTDSQT